MKTEHHYILSKKEKENFWRELFAFTDIYIHIHTHVYRGEETSNPSLVCNPLFFFVK